VWVILEIRTYKVKPGRLSDLVDAMAEARPLLADAGIDVVAVGPSLPHDEGDHAYILRAFNSVEERQELEDAFYSSEVWHSGPRAKVLDPIETYHTVVLDLPKDAIDALRGQASV
jgi:hypothetical protein